MEQLTKIKLTDKIIKALDKEDEYFVLRNCTSKKNKESKSGWVIKDGGCKLFTHIYLPTQSAEIDTNELKDSVLNVLQQVDITKSRSGNDVIADIDDKVDSIFSIFAPYLSLSPSESKTVDKEVEQKRFESILDKYLEGENYLHKGFIKMAVSEFLSHPLSVKEPSKEVEK